MSVVPTYFEDAAEAMHDRYDPVVPCRGMETRPCVDLSLTHANHFRTGECKQGECTRFEKRVDIDAEIVRLKKEGG